MKHQWYWSLILITFATSALAVQGEDSSESPEAKRFQAEKEKRSVLYRYVTSAKHNFDRAWQSWHPPALGKLLITKLKLTLNAAGKIAECKIVASSGSHQEDMSAQECLNTVNFAPLPVGTNAIDLFWTVMSDGSLNIVECTDSEEANAYNSNLIGGILPPKGDSLITRKTPPTSNISGTGGPAEPARADFDFGPYMADLQRRIQHGWVPPGTDASKRVSVQFKVGRGGELSNLRVTRSSGEDIWDQAALAAVTHASPFRPLPPGAGSVLDIDYSFSDNNKQPFPPANAHTPINNTNVNNTNEHPPVAAQPDFDYATYNADVRRRVKRAWFPPRGHESDQAQVGFKINQTGQVSGVRLLRSSGVDISDQAALKAVENASPFPPVPAGLDYSYNMDFPVH